MPGQFKHRRSQFIQTDEIANSLPFLQSITPSYGHRNMSSRVITIRQATRHLPAVVARIDEERIVQETVFLKPINNLCRRFIDARNGSVVA